MRRRDSPPRGSSTAAGRSSWPACSSDTSTIHADLVLLELDASALPVAPVEEDTTGRGERFPHLYARIPWSAMRHRRPLATGGETGTIRHGDLAVSGETTAWLRRFLCFGTLTDADLSGCLADSWARPDYAPDRAELYGLSPRIRVP
ncbi:MAG: DUF952 domain-containing protein [Gammaproteobacteria bacterium]|nr:DUF952 domain-containing protein [Gammaproteobacteria bacterium]